MTKTFDEVMQNLREGVSKSKSGKPTRTFSRTDFNKLAVAFLNEVEYQGEVASIKQGELQLGSIEPVKAFRKLFYRVLTDFGVDKQEAERVLTNEYSFSNADGAYEFISELIFNYLDAGKKFDFIAKADFKGSLVLDEIGESVKEHRNIKDPGAEPFKVKKKKHRVVKAKSTAPDWLKSRV